MRKAMHHFFDESVNPSYQFPPSGKTFEVAYQAKPATENAMGTLYREDCDLFFLAWLMKFDSVRADVAKKKLFCAAADKVNIRFNYRPTEDQGRVRTPSLERDVRVSHDTARRLGLERRWPFWWSRSHSQSRAQGP